MPPAARPRSAAPWITPFLRCLEGGGTERYHCLLRAFNCPDGLARLYDAGADRALNRPNRLPKIPIRSSRDVQNLLRQERLDPLHRDLDVGGIELNPYEMLSLLQCHDRGGGAAHERVEDDSAWRAAGLVDRPRPMFCAASFGMNLRWLRRSEPARKPATPGIFKRVGVARAEEAIAVIRGERQSVGLDRPPPARSYYFYGTIQEEGNYDCARP